MLCKIYLIDYNIKMIFSILTYNLLYGAALKEIRSIVDEYQPDILCFQEFPIDDKENNSSLFKNYKLAGSANSFIKSGKIYGLATFYHQNKVSVSSLANQKVPHTFYDWFRFIRNFFKKRVKREFLKTTFKINSSKKTINIFNVHLTAEATNEARINQIKEILKSTKKITSPLIIIGDFNYAPYSRRKLENLFKNNKFKEATSNIDYTFFFKKNLFFYTPLQKFFLRLLTKITPERLKLDYIFYKKLTFYKCERIESRVSDHYPILAFFKV